MAQWRWIDPGRSPPFHSPQSNPNSPHFTRLHNADSGAPPCRPILMARSERKETARQPSPDCQGASEPIYIATTQENHYGDGQPSF
ncbi:MAG: hypothetical protein VKJ64_07775 [Leptolyngbyaceae bacterium]|nr:hypothetical protein [Leptolyngbyaceae bacterium]